MPAAKKSTTPTVSVLMPIYMKTRAYSYLTWLKAALDSALAQDLDGTMEIVVIDDAPALRAQPIIEAWYGSAMRHPIRFVTPPVNMGLIRGLNLGLTVAQGRFIARLDQDDEWTPGKIQRQLDLFRQDPDLALSFGSMDLINPAGEFVERHSRRFNWEETIYFSQHVGCPIPHGSVMLPREVYLAFGGYPYEPTAFSSEDFNLWGQLMRFFKVSGDQDIFLKYRVHENSMSAVDRGPQQANTATIMSRLRSLGAPHALTGAIDRLAKDWGVTTLEAGFTLQRLWRVGGEVSLSPERLEDLRRVLLDRCVEPLEGDSKLVVAVTTL